MSAMRRMRPLLGTFVEIGVLPLPAGHGADSDESLAISSAFEAIERMQALLSFHDADSELSQLNRSVRAVKLHPLSALALRLGRRMMRASGGLFDCTVGGRMIRLGVLPNHAASLPLPGGCADDIELRGHTARLRRRVHITLDGLAKGLAVDMAVAALRAAGVRAGWVNAGGDLRAFGDAEIPVYRRELDGALTALGILREGAIASSAVKPVADARFPGVIVSSAGREPATGVWSVRADSAWRADALTKVAALADPGRRAALIARLGGALLEPQPERKIA